MLSFGPSVGWNFALRIHCNEMTVLSIIIAAVHDLFSAAGYEHSSLYVAIAHLQTCFSVQILQTP